MLTTHRAFISGASSGIGLATAKAFAAAGARVALFARRLNILKEHAAAIGERAFALRGDVRELRSMEIAADHVKKKWGAPADIVVVNAGIVKIGEIAAISAEDWNDVIATNLTGAFNTTHAFLPGLLEGPSDLVFIASTASYDTWPTWGAYCASKWGVLGLARSVAHEVRQKGVRVTIVAPGAVDTDIWPGEKKPQPEKMLKAEDVAAAIVNAVSADRRASYDEVRVMPASGLL
ncbi:MAG: short-chain dehydrogenase/reductase [Planctomycetota bacterium]|nr:MAG: short-chain dehydrogenase/reductase [Planctomycetota bacterium]